MFDPANFGETYILFVYLMHLLNDELKKSSRYLKQSSRYLFKSKPVKKSINPDSINYNVMKEELTFDELNNIFVSNQFDKYFTQGKFNTNTPTVNDTVKCN
jgi:hypothetical protein